MTLKKHGSSNRRIASQLGVSEGTIRYRMKRAGKEDGRKKRASVFDEYDRFLKQWVESVDQGGKRPTLSMRFDRVTRTRAAKEARTRFVAS